MNVTGSKASILHDLRVIRERKLRSRVEYNGLSDNREFRRTD